jgi:hypothetical protein
VVIFLLTVLAVYVVAAVLAARRFLRRKLQVHSRLTRLEWTFYCLAFVVF